MIRKRYAALELAGSLSLLALALALNYFIGAYAERVGNTAHTSPDLLLRVLPIMDLRFLYLWGFTIFAIVAVLTALLRERERVSYLARIYGLLIALRSVCMVLTPMRIPEGALSVDGDPFYDLIGRFFTVRNDLFFSLHTALPFLGFLAFREKWLRYFCGVVSVLMAATVLLGRHHYSIDVVGAYGITYALFVFERRWLEAPLRSFKKRASAR